MRDTVRGNWGESLCFGLVCFLLYWFLQQQILYGDGSFTLVSRAAGALVHENHLLNHLLVAIGQRIARPFCADVFGEMSFAMRLFVASGVVVAHRTAIAFGWERARRAAYTLMIGGSGVAVFYGTAIELQGAFFPFAALAFHALVHCGRRPNVQRALLLGAATALATLVHATGHLLFSIVVPWLLLGCGGELVPAPRKRLLAVVVAGTCHAAIVLAAIGVIALYSGRSSFASQASVIARFADLSIAWLPFSLVREWLLPFLPGSLLVLATLFSAPTRRVGLAAAIAFVPYQTFTLLVLRDFDERGAYDLPLVFPAALCAVLVLPRILLWLAVLTAVASGVALNREYARTLPDPPSADAVAEITDRGSAVLLFVGPWSVRPILRHVPAIAQVDLVALVTSRRSFAAICSEFDAGYAAVHASGRRVLIARESLENLATLLDLPPDQMRFFSEHLLVHYRLVEGRAAGFRYFGVEPLPR